MQVSRSRAFLRREETECPSCGSDEIRSMACGRNVCTDCGMIVRGGSSISSALPPRADGESFSAVMPPDPVTNSSPVRRIREWHPACERAATSLARRIAPEFMKGMSGVDRVRHTQALAYLAYRDDNQTNVTIAQLAAQIRVPEEKLSKDVKAVAAHLGITGFRSADAEEDDDGADDAEFSRAVLGLVKPGRLAKGANVRTVNRWCRDMRTRAADAGEVELVNLAPRHQADAAIALFCENCGSPFVDGAFGPPKRARNGTEENRDATAVRTLLKNATARKAAGILRKYARPSAMLK